MIGYTWLIGSTHSTVQGATCDSQGFMKTNHSCGVALFIIGVHSIISNETVARIIVLFMIILATVSYFYENAVNYIIISMKLLSTVSYLMKLRPIVSLSI